MRLIWLASLFDVFGGGKIVFNTLTQVMIAEVVPSSYLCVSGFISRGLHLWLANPYFRSTVYYYLTAILSIVRVTGLLGGSYLLGTSLWLPLELGVMLYVISIPLLLFLPRSHSGPSGKSDNEADDENHLLGSLTNPLETATMLANEELEEDKSLQSSPQPRSRSPFSILLSFKVYAHHAWTYKSFLNIFFLHEAGMGVRDITEQWMSKRYTWTIRTTGYVLAGGTLFSSIVLWVLPLLGHHLQHARKISPSLRDVYLMRGSLLAGTTGTALIAVASSRWMFLAAFGVFTFGAGFHDALKSHVTQQVGKEKVTPLYMCISMCEMGGNILNGPLWAGIYSIGLGIEGVGMMMPFLVCTLIFMGTLGLVWRLKPDED